ncbi:Pr6Pr family membrane protein [Convivina praedatoris]|uniref:Pr6Pr family membrane protein n=1 Tax=Convivina praedatoris TaxID=2880963 RepID=A0ABN8H736_9LACO|nr:Pr6Pr family membrane protein [Convivina sp. LMG 32447]CAH1849886.1 hypothetical protein R077815_00004 [Convivina sp. LMG 32447]CAH1849890.1 hypothetical protein LMG032447_00006 [Convivina sp. LMG 32447]CAH1851351.1 hypothetical protein R078138_00326 [Convivina sp. LMG 32447]
MPIIKNKRIALSYEAILILIAIYGVFINTGLDPRAFLYYTTLSNLLCMLYFAYNIVRTLQNKPINHNFKGAITLAITVTMLIYWCILAPYNFDVHNFSQLLGTLCVHLFVPLMAIFDWILFDKKGHFSKWAPLSWLAIPLVYYVFAVIAASCNITFANSKHYPYFFIDSNLLGWGPVLLIVLALTIFFLIFGYLFYFIDTKWGAKGHK